MEKIRKHTRRHSLLYTISGVVLLFVGLAVTWNYHYIISTRKTFYTSTLERQSLSELNLYQEGSVTLVKQYFDQALGTITNLAINGSVQQLLRTNQSAPLIAALDQQRTISGQFDSLSIITAKGNMLAFSTNAGAVPPGTDESTSPAYLAGKAATGAVLIDAHNSQLGRVVFSIAAPIKDKDGHLLGTASGAITLASLAQHIHLSSGYDTGFSSLLTDASGNALVWQGKPVAGLLNEKNKEQTLKALMQQGSVPANQEYNFAGKNSFAEGNTLDFGTGGKLYLVGFYDVSGYQQQINEGLQDISATFSGFIVRDGLLLLSALVVIGVIIKVHETRGV